MCKIRLLSEPKKGGKSEFLSGKSNIFGAPKLDFILNGWDIRVPFWENQYLYLYLRGH